MNDEELIEEAREWSRSYASWDNERLIGELRLRGDRMSHRAADAIEAGEARIKELEKELALLQVPEGYPKRPSARAWAAILDRANTAEARIAELEAERDAALAVLERIREAVSGHPECDRYEEGDVISCGWKSAYASVVAALDGAPEPEWEYSRGVLHENGLLHAGFGIPRDQVVNVRRRKAGPWLPVSSGEGGGE